MTFSLLHLSLRSSAQDTDHSKLTVLSSDVALGYFSSLEFTTDLELSLPFVREMCHYARTVHDHRKNSNGQTTETVDRFEDGHWSPSRPSTTIDSMDLEDGETFLPPVRTFQSSKTFRA